MRSVAIGLILILSLAPGAALAQGAPPGPSGPPPASAPPLPRGSVTRDTFVKRAAERAGVLFDQMDTNHDGILTPDERRAWRAQHPPRSGQPPPQ